MIIVDKRQRNNVSHANCSSHILQNVLRAYFTFDDRLCIFRKKMLDNNY